MCEQEFSRAMKLGLAETWFSKVRGLSKDNEERLCASEVLADAWHEEGKYADAETMHREVLEGLRRLLGPEHPRTLGSASSLA